MKTVQELKLDDRVTTILIDTIEDAFTQLTNDGRDTAHGVWPDLIDQLEVVAAKIVRQVKAS